MAIPSRDILQLATETNENLADEQSLNAFAQRAGWSKFHLLREFRRITGETPKQYTQRVRLERAAAALNASSKSILTISLGAGFNSHEVFVRAFRKYFGCSPSQYRRKSLIRKLGPMSERYEPLVNSISPCIGLFHINNERIPDRSESVNPPQITRIQLEPQPILFIRRKIDQTQLQPYFAECFGTLFVYGMRQGLPITGNPIARYVSTSPGLWTVDCVLPLAQAAEEAEGLQAGFLEGGTILKAVHFGPYEKLKDSYVFIQNWMDNEGVSQRSPHWEQYVTDPGEEPDPSKWQTDIYWPIE